MPDKEIEFLAAKAKEGDRESLEHLVIKVRDQLFNLSLRMLGRIQDAEDATQEIMIKIIKGLKRFRADSSFETWMFRITVNHLINATKAEPAQKHLNFEDCGAQIDKGLSIANSASSAGPEEKLFAGEIKNYCLLVMLQCLDKKHRIAFLLDEIFGLSAQEASDVLGISNDNYRKRLSRSKNLLRDFMKNACGLIDTKNRCSCEKQIPYALKVKWIDRNNLVFAKTEAEEFTDLREFDELRRIAFLFKKYPQVQPAGTLPEKIRSLIAGNEYSLFL